MILLFKSPMYCIVRTATHIQLALSRISWSAFPVSISSHIRIHTCTRLVKRIPSHIFPSMLPCRVPHPDSPRRQIPKPFLFPVMHTNVIASSEATRPHPATPIQSQAISPIPTPTSPPRPAQSQAQHRTARPPSSADSALARLSSCNIVRSTARSSSHMSVVLLVRSGPLALQRPR